MHEYKARVLRVVDGDTLDVDIDCGFSVHVHERLRLLGVDTPETYGVKQDSVEYARGMKAKDFVINWLEDAGGVVVIRTTKDRFTKGKYGRWLAEVCDPRSEKPTLNACLLVAGLAVKIES